MAHAGAAQQPGPRRMAASALGGGGYLLLQTCQLPVPMRCGCFNISSNMCHMAEELHAVRPSSTEHYARRTGETAMGGVLPSLGPCKHQECVAAIRNDRRAYERRKPRDRNGRMLTGLCVRALQIGLGKWERGGGGWRLTAGCPRPALGRGPAARAPGRPAAPAGAPPAPAPLAHFSHQYCVVPVKLSNDVTSTDSPQSNSLEAS